MSERQRRTPPDNIGSPVTPDMIVESVDADKDTSPNKPTSPQLPEVDDDIDIDEGFQTIRARVPHKTAEEMLSPTEKSISNVPLETGQIKRKRILDTIDNTQRQDGITPRPRTRARDMLSGDIAAMGAEAIAKDKARRQSLSEESDLLETPAERGQSISGESSRVIISPDAYIPETDNGTQIMTPQTSLWKRPTTPPERQTFKKTTPPTANQPAIPTSTTKSFWRKSKILGGVLGVLTALGIRLSTDHDRPAEPEAPTVTTSTDTPDGGYNTVVGYTESTPTTEYPSQSRHTPTPEQANAVVEQTQTLLDEVLERGVRQPVEVATRLATILAPFMPKFQVREIVSDMQPLIHDLNSAVDTGRTGDAVRIRSAIVRRTREAVDESERTRRPPTRAELEASRVANNTSITTETRTAAVNTAINSIHARRQPQRPGINDDAMDEWLSQPHPTTGTRHGILNTPPTEILPINVQDITRSDRAARYDVARNAELARIDEVRTRIAQDNAQVRANQTVRAVQTTSEQISQPPNALTDTQSPPNRYATSRTNRDTVPIDLSASVVARTPVGGSIAPRELPRVPQPNTATDFPLPTRPIDIVHQPTETDDIPELSTDDLEDDEDAADAEPQTSITVGGHTITRGGTIEMTGRSGKPIIYTVVEIITNDQNPDRLILRSLDGRINTFKDLSSIEKNPTSIRTIT